MTGLDSVPLINPASEVEGLDVIRPVKTDDVENGNMFSNCDGSLQPQTENASSLKVDQLNEERAESSSSHASIGAVSDAGGSTSETSLPDSCIRMEDDGEAARSLDFGFDCCNMVDGERGILFHPDFVRFPGRSYASKPVVMFLASCIQVKFSAANGDQEDFCIQLSLDDIINIESWWIGAVETAKVKIHTISNGAVDAEGNSRFSGVEALKFVVKDACWYEKQEAIQSLDARYNSVWTAKIDTEMEEYGEPSEPKAVQFPTTRHFPEFEPFEDFIYPKGDPDAVSISKRDIDLLEPDTFLNDTIIDFYVKYLKDKISPGKRRKYHFFNSFFFRKLGDLEKYSSDDFDGRAAFLRVRKWTRKVNLFEKDFVFIPVNHCYHWSLLVICHPGEVANFTDEDANKLDRVPCILHMDSIRGTHVNLKDHIPLKDRIQSYLWEEWKERQKETSEDISSKFSNLRFVSLELPQQQNSYDCGLFLLHYVEKFLKEDPVNINPFKIRHKFLTANWFPPCEPSLKRREIWKLIHDLLKCHSRESSPASGSKKCCPSSSPKTENPIEFLPQSLSPSRFCNGNLLCTQAEKGIEMTLFPASLAVSNCASNSGVIVRDLFEPGAAAGALLDMQYQAFDRSTSFNEFKCAVASIQQSADTCDNFMYTTSTENGLQNLGGIASGTCAYPCPSRDFRAEVSWNPEMSIHQATEEALDSSPVVSVYRSDKAFKVQVEKTEPLEVQEIGKSEALKVKEVETYEASRETNLDHEKRHTLTETDDCFIDSFPSAPCEILQVSASEISIQPPEPNSSSDPLGAFAKTETELSDYGNGMDIDRTEPNGSSDPLGAFAKTETELLDHGNGMDRRGTEPNASSDPLDAFAKIEIELPDHGNGMDRHGTEPNGSSDPLDAFAKPETELLDHVNGMNRHRSRSCDNRDDSALDSDMQHAAKRLRLSP